MHIKHVALILITLLLHTTYYQIKPKKINLFSLFSHFWLSMSIKLLYIQSYLQTDNLCQMKRKLIVWVVCWPNSDIKDFSTSVLSNLIAFLKPSQMLSHWKSCIYVIVLLRFSFVQVAKFRKCMVFEFWDLGSDVSKKEKETFKEFSTVWKNTENYLSGTNHPHTLYVGIFKIKENFNFVNVVS